MKITKNFDLREFRSKDGASFPTEVIFNIQKLASQLQMFRELVKKPITINSGYRSKSHNKKVGGSPNSQHLLGKAADIKVKGLKPKTVYDKLSKLMDNGDLLQGGLGLYDTFVHYDIRKTRVRWDFTTKK